MRFTEITLERFRNYGQETVRFHPNVNIITGQNAQGKTNLLESLSMMSLGRSFRTGKDQELIRFGEDNCRIRATYQKEGELATIDIQIRLEGKSIRVDGNRIGRMSDLLDGAYIVVFSPEDLKIVKDEPEKRRRFIDRELCQLRPVYYSSLSRYKKVLQHRNALLRQESADPDSLQVWDASLADYGSRIMRERTLFVRTLSRISRDLHSGITNGREELVLRYEPDLPFEEKATVEELRDALYEALQKGLRRDKSRGTTCTGPHRDDLLIQVNGTDLRQYGSQGQQRTAALAMKLAEIRLIQEDKREDPVLLLDDVLSELDEERKRFLVECLSDVQLFLTTTEPEEPFLERLPSSFVFRVREGTVEKLFDIKKE